MNYTTVDIPRGTEADRIFQVRDPSGSAFGPALTPANVSPFTGSETLAASVWAGDETASLATPTATWDDATIGTILVSFAAADTSGLSLGTYQGQVTATSAGKTGRVLRFQVKLTPVPGTQTVALAFTVTDDLLRYANWIEDLQGERQVAGFAEEQARATEDLIQILVRLYKSGGSMAPTLGQPGWNATTLGYGSDLPSKWFRDQITPVAVDADHPANAGNPGIYSALIVRELTKEYCAKKAIAYICQGQLGRKSDRDYWALANYFTKDAESLLRTYMAEIDLAIPQTGWASITVNCGGGSLR